MIHRRADAEPAPHLCCILGIIRDGNMSTRYGLIRQRSFSLFFCVFLILLLILSPLGKAAAHSLLLDSGVPQREPTPSELINAVNALRASHGLPELKVHRILMQTAQSQANALLEIGRASCRER